jgi:cytochrome c
MINNKISIIAIMIFACTMLFCSCGSKEKKVTAEDYGTPEETINAPEVASDAITLGESLIKASDCKTCHHTINKIIGPSYTEVAKKYEFTKANVELLAGKIIKGGSGIWGEVPMAAHADVTPADAEKMARYVLSLDGEKEQ